MYNTTTLVDNKTQYQTISFNAFNIISGLAISGWVLISIITILIAYIISLPLLFHISKGFKLSVIFVFFVLLFLTLTCLILNIICLSYGATISYIYKIIWTIILFTLFIGLAKNTLEVCNSALEDIFQNYIFLFWMLFLIFPLLLTDTIIQQYLWNNLVG